MSTEEFYDKKARRYFEKRGKGIIGKVVRKEREYVISNLDLKVGDSVLDAGCGPGFYSYELKRLGFDIYGFDISKNMIEHLKKLGIKGSVENLENFNLDKKFDRIISTGAIEFCENQDKVISNFKNHLKADGTLIILYSSPCLGGYILHWYHKLQKSKMNLISNRKMREMLVNKGFKIEGIGKIDFFVNAVKARL